MLPGRQLLGPCLQACLAPVRSRRVRFRVGPSAIRPTGPSSRAGQAGPILRGPGLRVFKFDCVRRTTVPTAAWHWPSRPPTDSNPSTLLDRGDGRWPATPRRRGRAFCQYPEGGSRAVGRAIRQKRYLLVAQGRRTVTCTVPGARMRSRHRAACQRVEGHSSLTVAPLLVTRDGPGGPGLSGSAATQHPIHARSFYRRSSVANKSMVPLVRLARVSQAPRPHSPALARDSIHSQRSSVLVANKSMVPYLRLFCCL